MTGQVLAETRRAAAVRGVSVALVLGALILAGGAVMLAAGRVGLSLTEVIDALRGEGSRTADQVIWGIRMPRYLTAVAVGASLAVSGAATQSLSRNPLGSPDILGFTAGAATGAVVQIMLLGQGPVATLIAAVLAGWGTMALVYLLARRFGTTEGPRLPLVGIGVGATLAAISGLLLSEGGIDEAQTALQWLAGSLAGRTWIHAIPGLVGLVAFLPLLILARRDLRVMELGDDLAGGLGVRVERVRVGVLIAAVGLASIATGVAGPIAFIALAAPQVARRLVGRPGPSIVTSALTGAVMLVAADLFATRMPIGIAMPVGTVTGLFGGAYLVVLLLRSARRA